MLGKLPTLQHYSCLESIEIQQYNQMNANRLQKLQGQDGKLDERANLGSTVKKMGMHVRVNSPVPEEHTLEQCENTVSSSTPPEANAMKRSNN